MMSDIAIKYIENELKINRLKDLLWETEYLTQFGKNDLIRAVARALTKTVKDRIEYLQEEDNQNT